MGLPRATHLIGEVEIGLGVKGVIREALKIIGSKNHAMWVVEFGFENFKPSFDRLCFFFFGSFVAEK